MAKNYNYNERRHNRYHKAMRRIKEDRAQHGSDHSCPCFQANGKGYEFSMFADSPKRCSYPTCCGNPRKIEGPTLQELRAATEKDWE